jgi:hypothetical protein
MLTNFKDFYEDFLLESIINETFIYFSPPLRKELKKIEDNPIAKDLLEIEGEDISSDITLVNVNAEDPGLVTFTTKNNLERNLHDFFNDDEFYLKRINLDKEKNIKQADAIYNLSTNDYQNLDIFLGQGIFTSDNSPYQKGRSSVRLGRFIKKLLPGKYKDSEIETFVNLFKSKFLQGDLEIIEGEDIDWAYWYENYTNLNGTLGSSCMAEKKGLLKLYTQNPQVCKLLVLKDGDKVSGRALLWKCKFQNPKIETDWFMDRVYTNEDLKVNLFKSWAKKNNAAYKTYNSHHNYESVTWKDVNYTTEIVVENLNIEKIYKFPYMDTFKRLDLNNKSLHNDKNSTIKYGGCYILEETDGGFEEVDSGIWSKYHNRYIDGDNANYSSGLGSYIEEDESIWCVNTNTPGWYPRSWDGLVNSNGNWYVKADCEQDENGNWHYKKSKN